MEEPFKDADIVLRVGKRTTCNEPCWTLSALTPLVVDVFTDLPALRRDPEHVCDLLNTVANILLQPLKLARHDALLDLIEKNNQADEEGMHDVHKPNGGFFTEKDFMSQAPNYRDFDPNETISKWGGLFRDNNLNFLECTVIKERPTEKQDVNHTINIGEELRNQEKAREEGAIVQRIHKLEAMLSPKLETQETI